MSRIAAVVAVVLAVVSVAVSGVASAATRAPTVDYRPPVPSSVTDRYRPPPAPWAAGNRGWTYVVVPGIAVDAAADGTVVFAGAVGGTLAVSILHADGVRTTYSYLVSIAVRRGQHVTAGEKVGLASGLFHFGALVGDTYLDPASLFATGPPRVHLTPTAAEMGTSSEERDRVRGLLRFAERAARVAAGAVTWAAGGTADAATQAWLRPAGHSTISRPWCPTRRRAPRCCCG
jgi:murein DD-endopeptidase MepM/ murein hydrolase activator NlpD